MWVVSLSPFVPPFFPDYDYEHICPVCGSTAVSTTTEAWQKLKAYVVTVGRKIRVFI